MKLGISVRNTGPRSLAAVQRLPVVAEEANLDAVWFSDHVVGVRGMESRYGPVWLEALSCMAYAAATTTTIRIGVSVLVVPYRHPLYAAKTLATVDQLAGGRLNIGFGSGWSRREFRALGVGDLFDGRGAATDEGIDVMFKCWEGGEVSFTGDVYDFKGVTFLPKPLQPRPRIYVGGHTPAALRRTARVADVWHPVDLTSDEVTTIGATLDKTAGRHVARCPRIFCGLDDPMADRVKSYSDAGCEELVVDVVTDDPTDVERAISQLGATTR